MLAFAVSLGLAVPAPAATVMPSVAPPIAAPAAPPTGVPTPLATHDAAPAPAPAPSPTPAPDPLRGFNRLSYAVSQPVDRFLLRPVAVAYTHVVPHPLRDGVHNALGNLFEPVVFVNDLLQLRFKRALHTAARMAVNTAFGIGGLFDVAKRPYFKLPGHPNGFADTLGVYGVGPGPYLYLPVLGPTTLRDALGGAGDLFAQPRLLGKLISPDSDKPFFHSSAHLGHTSTAQLVLGGVDERAQAEGPLQALKAGAVDPYATLRSSYLQARAGEVAALKARGDGRGEGAADGGAGAGPAGAGAGVAPNPALDDPLADPAVASAPASAAVPAGK